MLHRGKWEHKQLVSRQWAERVVAYAGLPLPHGPLEPDPTASGLGWWTNSNGGWPGVPKDAFGGAGSGHQFVMVVPSLDLVVVRNGQPINPEGHVGVAFWPPLVDHVARPVVEAMAAKGCLRPVR